MSLRSREVRVGLTRVWCCRVLVTWPWSSWAVAAAAAVAVTAALTCAHPMVVGMLGERCVVLAGWFCHGSPVPCRTVVSTPWAV